VAQVESHQFDVLRGLGDDGSGDPATVAQAIWVVGVVAEGVKDIQLRVMMCCISSSPQPHSQQGVFGGNSHLRVRLLHRRNQTPTQARTKDISHIYISGGQHLRSQSADYRVWREGAPACLLS
jgi:hypothetical protein